MSWRYVLRRLVSFVATIVVGATLIFVITRLTPQDPIRALLGRMAAQGGSVSGGAEIVEMYRQRFGLDQPIVVQYLRYMYNLLFHFDMGYSIANFPASVVSVVATGIPWTLGLLFSSTFIAFLLGNLLGALSAWPAVPKVLRYAIYGLAPISAVPYYVLALMLMYLLAVYLPVFPIGGALTVGSDRAFGFALIWDILRHAMLPGLSIVLSLTGFWILSMRGALTMVSGEGYLTYARAKGLREWRIFGRYAVRNSSLPQVTALALDLGRVISGQVLVEVIFNYPGVGYILFNALRTADYFVIQGVVMFIIVSVALSTLILDLIYPLLDPRISYADAAR